MTNAHNFKINSLLIHGGIGFGQMIVELPPSEKDQETIISFFTKGGLSVTEVETNE